MTADSSEQHMAMAGLLACCLVRYRLLTQLVDGQVPVQCWADVGRTLGRERKEARGAGLARLLGAAGAGQDQGAAQRQREKKKDRKEGFLLAI